ncbi:MAG: hypothetical protein GY829_15250 [Gammaproteobacteria bacterium]|nr:hypothetical protein [Gammaproteobacteria bacterium]
MNNSELIIIVLNSIVITIAYFVIYPRFCGSDGNKIAKNDVIASAIPLVVVGSVYWGTGQEFSMLFFTLNWFWFTLLSYAIIEIPLMLWYFQKNNVWSSFNKQN